MLPLTELPSEAISELAGVVFDVDDTLTRHGRLEAVAFSSLWRLHQAGLKLVAVTGRPLGWAEVLVHHWPVDVAVGENGAGWFWPSPLGLQRGHFVDAATRQNHSDQLAQVVEQVRLRFPEVQVTQDAWARRCDVAFDIGEHACVSDQRIRSLVACIENCGARAVVSSVHAHACFGAWNKASGVVAALREALGIDLETQLQRWLFVGDSGNDAAAFSYFPVTVGVANVRAHLAHLPVPPAYVTQAERGEGFCELSERLLSEQRCRTSSSS